MKTRLHHYALCCIVLCAFASCDHDADIEEPTPIVDYRDAFIGDYASHQYCLSWTLNNLPGDTTFWGPVTVVVTKPADADSSIIIDGNLVPVKPNGSVNANPYSVDGYRFYSAQFRNDSLFMGHSSGSGLGGSTDCQITGVKQ